MRSIWRFILALALLAPAFARADEAPGQGLAVFVSILPQAFFVERVGGAHVDVEVLVGPGQSPATYDPPPKQLARLGSARVYFRIGVPFEQTFIQRLSSAFPKLVVVDTRQDVPLRLFRPSRGRQAPDPHIWLDPNRVAIQARTIRDTLCRLDPARKAAYDRNLAAFVEELGQLDRRIRDRLGPFRGEKVFVFHPAFGYFCDAYGLQQVAVQVEGKEPSARQLARLIDRARREHVRVIFVQPQFSRDRAETLAEEIGGAVVPIDPLPRDYVAALDRMSLAIRESLGAR